jgi:Tol biopolymer transport system component
MVRFRVALLAALVVAAAATATPARAAFPGHNGQLVMRESAIYHGHVPFGLLATVPSTGGDSSLLPAPVPPLFPCSDLNAPAWSADGARLAYARTYADCDVPFVTHDDVVVARADGTHPRVIASEAFFPTWSPDGRQLAATIPGLLSLTTSAVAIINVADGSYAAAIDNRSYAVFSPDGQRLAAIGAKRGKLFVSDVDGSNRTTVAHNVRTRVDWSPDGSRLAFGQLLDGTTRIVTMSRFGGPMTPVTPQGVDAMDPAWSPDGTRIAYSAAVGDDGWGVFAVPAAGGGPPKLLAAPSTHSGQIFAQPAWRPSAR